MVGSLMYPMVATWLNIAYLISVVSKYIVKHDSKHWMAVKRIMCYLKETYNVKLYLGGINIVLSGYCNEDYVRNIDD